MALSVFLGVLNSRNTTIFLYYTQSGERSSTQAPAKADGYRVTSTGSGPSHQLRPDPFSVLPLSKQ